MESWPLTVEETDAFRSSLTLASGSLNENDKKIRNDERLTILSTWKDEEIGQHSLRDSIDSQQVVGNNSPLSSVIHDLMNNPPVLNGDKDVHLLLDNTPRFIMAVHEMDEKFMTEEMAERPMMINADSVAKVQADWHKQDIQQHQQQQHGELFIFVQNERDTLNEEEEANKPSNNSSSLPVSRRPCVRVGDDDIDVTGRIDKDEEYSKPSVAEVSLIDSMTGSPTCELTQLKAIDCCSTRTTTSGPRISPSRDSCQLLRAHTYEQAQKASAPVSLSQILQRPASKPPCERQAGHSIEALPNKSHSPGPLLEMGHGASCLPVPSSTSNNCCATSFTPFSSNHQNHRSTAAAASAAAAVHTTTTTTTTTTGISPAANTSTHATAVTGVVPLSSLGPPVAPKPNMKVPEDYSYLCALVPELKAEMKERETRIDLLQTETLELKRHLRKRDEEIGRLQREIHKLKSVLQATSTRAHDGELLSSLHAFNKRQGVSGESSDPATMNDHQQITRYEKDFRVKQLIKDAIMDNDFLKNLDAGQVREIVDSMYPRDFDKGSYVIREGDAGSHLYVSAEGEFEVIQGDKVLGRMGPGKAFGELAILYNCTRTASIKAVTGAKVWVLDRRVFQQVMKRTGLQRIDDNVNFLRSVPLLTDLSVDHMSKIADVLEVEFYPSGTYIVRQGARGDNFFIISSGRVKVTQRLPGKIEEEEIRILEKGDYFGEKALLQEECRTANVIALPPGVECLTLGRESFIRLIGDLTELKNKDYGDDIRGFNHRLSSDGQRYQVQSEYSHIRLNDLDILATLGVGGFGRVELVQYIYDRSQTFALKCLKKQHIVNTQQQEHIYSEKNIMMSCRDPFIARLFNTYRDNKYVYMLMEACLGGEVWTILRDRGNFDDTTTCFYTACVIQAFEYLHSRNIIYRDLKPENLLLDSQGYVKLVDFGFSKVLGISNKTWTFCGTPEYVAPEIILNKGHDRAVDYWSLGILMFELLTGTPPFTASDPMKTYNIILKGIDQIEFPRSISRAAQTLIKRLCREVPAERLGYQKGGIEDIKKNRWFQGFDWDSLRSRTLPAPIQPMVRSSADASNFDTYPKDKDIPPDELSGWDVDF